MKPRIADVGAGSHLSPTGPIGTRSGGLGTEVVGDEDDGVHRRNEVRIGNGQISAHVIGQQLPTDQQTDRLTGVTGLGKRKEEKKTNIAYASWGGHGKEVGPVNQTLAEDSHKGGRGVLD